MSRTSADRPASVERLSEPAALLERRLRRLSRLTWALAFVAVAVAVPASLLWMRGGRTIARVPSAWVPVVIVVGLTGVACGLVGAILGLRVTHLSERLRRSRPPQRVEMPTTTSVGDSRVTARDRVS